MATSAHDKLLDALAENSLVKAALVMDHDGIVLSKRGQAKMLDRHNAKALAPGEKPDENLYLLELSEDLLAVIFEEGIEFERLRKAVDALVRHAGLAKQTES